MDATSELLTRERDSLVSRIRGLLEEKAKIDNTITGIQVKVDFIDEILAKAKRGGKSDNTLPLPSVGRYANMQLMQAVEDVINSDDEPFSVPAICERLKAEGFEETKELYSSVYVTCKRLSGKKRIEESLLSGKRVFSRISAGVKTAA